MDKEEFDYGIVLEWRNNGKIAILHTQGDMRRDAINLWANIVISLIDRFPEDQPIYAIHHLGGIGFSQYSRQRTRECFEAVSEGRKVYNAIAVQDSLVSRLMAFFIPTIKHKGGNIITRIFTTLDAAYDWVLYEMQVNDKSTDLKSDVHQP